ncbi:MAG: glutamine-hydrolyzing carbamoyl-phosphate synthase small subunit [Flavobacteriales bacterium]|nr:glutamine-hydrolyzing carbamoyl-phosphate synthase small subunit [Flavobacteriales bacterium]
MQTDLSSQKAILVLEDGTAFEGKAAGAIGTTTGEIAFNTGMYGYQEIFTDPSYYGQILVMATSHIGNYGVHDEEVESDGMKIAGLVTKKFSDVYSRVAGSGTLQDYLERDNKVGISDIDTRKLVRHIREKGAMNAIISSEDLDVESLRAKVKEVPSMEGLELSSKVTTKDKYTTHAENGKFNVALLDLGVKTNIVRCLTERGCNVTVYPMSTSAEEILASNPDGIMLSNGPGDPAAMPEVVAEVKKLVESGTPSFGICLGHQVIALSQGLATEKMFNGHRGVNHPIKNLVTTKSEITSQNHGFVVSMKSAEENDNIEVTHIHLNDDTLAGIRLKNLPVFSVQYHPEASAGPHDSRYLFDQFITNIASHSNAELTQSL